MILIVLLQLLPLWTINERNRLFGYRSVELALKEYDHLHGGNDLFNLDEFPVPPDLLPHDYSTRALAISSPVTNQGE